MPGSRSTSNVSTFLGLPASQLEPSGLDDVVLLGVPTDIGSDGRTGAHEGPRALRASSWTFGSYNHALGIDVLEEIRAVDGGDILVNVPESEREAALMDEVQRVVFGLCRGGQIPGLIGGNQALTLAALRGILQAKRRPVSLVHLTARHDLGCPLKGETGCMTAAVKEGLLRKGGVLQIGVRGSSRDGDESQEAFRAGFERLTIDDVRWDIHGSMETVRAMVGSSALYVSIDLSAFDPSVCPGVTLPSPGGLTSWEGQQVLRALVGADIVGFDVVGACPRFDQSELTSVVAVAMLHEVLSTVAAGRMSARVSVTGGSSGRTSA